MPQSLEGMFDQLLIPTYVSIFYYFSDITETGLETVDLGWMILAKKSRKLGQLFIDHVYNAALEEMTGGQDVW